MKEPIYKDDLKRVLLNGLLYSVVFGALFGALQFLTENYMGLSMGIFVFAISFLLARKISESFFTFHLWYPIITVCYFLLGYVIYNFTKIVFIFHDFQVGFKIFFSQLGLNFLFGFFNVFNYVGISALYNLLDLLIFVGSIITAWQIVYRRR